ncbi:MULTISPECIES: peptidase inhibitor family I36 protein [unclassified Streptomyces]|uniref:peptidase inhibitor family I36 protein n=1 Tax=unclassified Streptomyces TaxID=2593676 RepID=UPI003827B0A9
MTQPRTTTTPDATTTPRTTTTQGFTATTFRRTAGTVGAAVGALTLAVLLPQTGTAAPAAPAAPPRLGACASGELCLWAKDDFKGARQTHELSGTDIDSCVPLPAGTSAHSLANRTGRPVTTYQSDTCGETGEFETYPGKGTWLPSSPYRVRAFKIWER